MRLSLILLGSLLTVFAEQSIYPTGIITAVSSGVVLVHPGETTLVKVQVLDFIFENDTLILGDSGSTTIFYQDGRLDVIDSIESFAIPAIDTSGITSGVPAISNKVLGLFKELYQLKEWNGEMISKSLTKQGEDTLQMVIQRPGNTVLIDPRPDIIWSKYPGANWYNMRLQQGKQIISSIATTDTIFLFPENVEDLIGMYTIKVLAIRNSDTLYTATCSIDILDSTAIHGLRKISDNIGQRKPDYFTFHLLKAVLFKRNGLMLMAMDNYDKLIAVKPNEPVLYKAVAEIYYELGIPELGDAFLNLSKTTITHP